jgi:hypothetical protein
LRRRVTNEPAGRSSTDHYDDHDDHNDDDNNARPAADSNAGRSWDLRRRRRAQQVRRRERLAASDGAVQ